MLENVIRSLEPVATDEVGFRILCEEAQIVWLRVPYLKELAARDGPCPRMQDLNPDGTIVGRRPKGKMVTLSHGWDATYHFDPTGRKLRLLVEELNRLGITDHEDGVFIDFTGLSQRGACACMPDHVLPIGRGPVAIVPYTLPSLDLAW